jgi:hypothetical protein
LGRERGRWVRTEKELLVNGTKKISSKRGIKWDRFQIMVHGRESGSKKKEN